MIRKITHHTKRIAANIVNRIKGFTLIELLVVIAILGVLSAAVLVAINPGKRMAQARDAQRKSDINAIANAVIGYSTITGTNPASAQPGCDKSTGSNVSCIYPGQNNWSTSSGLYLGLIQSQQFMKKLPIDPINNAAYYYWYVDITGGNPGYWIGARLESPQDPTKPIFRCSDWSYTSLAKGCLEVPNWLE